MIDLQPSESLEAVERLLLQDYDLRSRVGSFVENTEHDTEIDAVCSMALRLSERLLLVYTAYDGDHFQLCAHMRETVLSHGRIPANPESILGYKDTVSARMSKRGVLVDDLAVLSHCDELWVFTDLDATPSSVQELAEGVVVELLFFLKRRPNATVQFVSVNALIHGVRPDLVKYRHTYAETVQSLAPDQVKGVLDLVNSGDKVDREIPSMIYHIIDPLDFKYASWLRPRVYLERSLAPLVPGLAAELRDFHGLSYPLTRALIAWTRLLKMANKAWSLPSMDSGRKPSVLVRVLECAWVRTHGGQTLKKKRWTNYPIPKATAKSRWPLTEREGGPK